MAPNFRTATQTRRSNRAGYVEHDDFEGLPVRQWRQEWVKIAPPPTVETVQKNDIWDLELPHGMPKDSNLLPPHTQELLRAARSGRLYKRPAPTDDDDGDNENAAPEKQDKKDDEDTSEKGFQVKVWKQIARTAEGAAVSHLAKRRKNTVTLSSDMPALATSGPTVMRATVRRVDAAGNPYTQEVTLNEGVTVDGEIISTTVVPASSGAAAGLDTTAPTPVRRRPPPPKRKSKGPGRGRKKKLQLPLAPGAAAGAAGHASGVNADGTMTQAVTQEGVDGENKDSEMADEDDDGDDGDEGDEDDEEDDEDDDNQEGENTPVADGGEPNQAQATTSTLSVQDQSNPVPMDISDDRPISASAPAPSLPSAPSPTGTPTLEGSPLKAVMTAQSPPMAAHDNLSDHPSTLHAESAPDVIESIEAPQPAAQVQAAQEATDFEPSQVLSPADRSGREENLDKIMADVPSASEDRRLDQAQLPEADFGSDAMAVDQDQAATEGKLPSPRAAASTEPITLAPAVAAESAAESMDPEPAPTPVIGGGPLKSPPLVDEIASIAPKAAEGLDEQTGKAVEPEPVASEAEVTPMPIVEPTAVPRASAEAEQPAATAADGPGDTAGPSADAPTPDLYSGLEAALDGDRKDSSSEAAPAPVEVEINLSTTVPEPSADQPVASPPPPSALSAEPTGPILPTTTVTEEPEDAAPAAASADEDKKDAAEVQSKKEVPATELDVATGAPSRSPEQLAIATAPVENSTSTDEAGSGTAGDEKPEAP
ncbi:hypothetical protein Micbo1qcDRAFT_42202 [Microdochium bolleyi]|uniref:Apopolysialoglycoprotein n=1 Tax=Microdochium bolleyi TaxID=196109 RepID=A0A136JAJ4_9PEZI|nr:hypothetical protein Micbo1qcDRAFT_42202 [Microdochium bolleyi]